jgi:hypothetical protein
MCSMQSRELLLRGYGYQKKGRDGKAAATRTLRLASSSCITPRSSCACLLRSAKSTSAVTARAAQYRAAEESGVVRGPTLPFLA